ncbi:MAG TPA: choice-of-anchor B family protein [Gemmatimonadota bacterium]|nr:choice-of-anchor B family protein [Gemmatimonadota bacterium]
MIRHLSLSLLFLVIAIPAAAQSMRNGGEPARPGFGSALAIAGGQVLVAEPNGVRSPGAVYVYGKQGAGWAEVERLGAENPAAGDLFGATIAASDDRLIVGALGGEGGVAYVFAREGDGWERVARLSASDGVPSDSFGATVAVAGDVALVGAAGADSGRGAVYVFRGDGSGAWSRVARIPAPAGTVPDDRFGEALAVDGETAIVAATRADSGRGAVYLYTGDGWGQTARIAPDSLTANARFGSAIAVGDGLVLVGAPGFNGFRGAVFAYGAEEGGWDDRGRIPFEGTPQERFGTSIAIAGDAAWIGAPGADRFAGAIYSLTPGTGGTAPAKLTLIDSLPQGGAFGGALALGETVAAVGIPGEDYGMGSAAIFERSGDAWALANQVESEAPGEIAAMTGTPRTCDSGKVGEFACSQVDLVSFLPVSAVGGGRGVRLAGIWGWTDPETGKEYALLGRMDGTSFVDISDPANPVYLGDLPKTEGSQGAIWREIKVYENHAFIVADGAGAHGMQVFDLTRLRDVENAPATFTTDAHYTRIQSAHNIVINEDSGFAYATGSNGGTETCGGGLHMIDVRDPRNPAFVGCFSDPTTGRQKTGYTHDALCVNYRGPDEDYQGREICFGSNETALSIADVTDKQNPIAVAMAEYPNVGYTHQGWLTEDQRYLYVDDELDELNGLVENTRTLVWDVSDLDDPVLAKEFFNPNTTAIDHNLYVKDDKMYQSNYVAGLRVLDIQEPTEPREVGFFDTVPFGDNGPRFDGSWSNYPFFESGIIAVTSMSEGLFLLRYREADRPIS